MPAAGSFERRARWAAASSVLPAVELRHRAPDWKLRQRARAVCRHAGHRSALPDGGEWLSERVRGMLRSVPFRPAARPAVCRRESAFDRRQQSLQRIAAYRRKTLGARFRAARELHLEIGTAEKRLARGFELHANYTW